MPIVRSVEVRRWELVDEIFVVSEIVLWVCSLRPRFSFV